MSAPATPEVLNSGASAEPPLQQKWPDRIKPWQTVLILAVLCIKLFLVIYTFWLVLTCIHELGHMVGGRVCGLELLDIRVGPLSFSRPIILGRKVSGTWRWNWRWTNLLGGGVRMYANGLSLSGIRWRYFIHILAGPLANLGCALLVVPFAIRETGFGAFAKFFLLGSLFLGFGNLITFKRHGTESDGSKIGALLFTESRREAFLFGCTLLAQIEKIRNLCLEGKTEEACALVDGAVKKSESIPALSANDAYMQQLATLRDFVHGTTASNPDSWKTP